MSFMPSVIYAQCHIKALYAECHYAECRYAECRYAEYHGTHATAVSLPSYDVILAKLACPLNDFILC